MTDRPILFSAPMVKALLDGRKTMTRRVLKPQPPVNVTGAGRYGASSAPGFWKDEWSWLSGDQTDIDALEFEGEFRTRFCEGDRLFPAMPIPSLNRNYCADLHGRIWSRARDGETWESLKGSPTSKGYLSVTPAHEGHYRTRLVHRLIAEAFYGYQPNGLRQVRHLNGDQIDNAPENLDWGTQEDNWSDRYAHGRTSGERHHAAKLTSAMAEKIRISSASQRALATQFGVAQSTIWAIKSNRCWQENPKQNPPNCPRWASRLTLIVTGVRVQRVQEISREDAVAEGLEWVAPTYGISGQPHWDQDPLYPFMHLWNGINAKRGYGWDANPWVVAVTFTVHRENIDQLADAASRLFPDERQARRVREGW